MRQASSHESVPSCATTRITIDLLNLVQRTDELILTRHKHACGIYGASIYNLGKITYLREHCNCIRYLYQLPPVEELYLFHGSYQSLIVNQQS